MLQGRCTVKGMRKLAAFALLSLGLAQAQAGPQLFGLTNPQATLLLRWTENAGQLSGAIQIVSVVKTTSGIETNVFNGVVKGVRSGTNYSFTIDKPASFLGGSAMDGVLNGDVLDVQVPLNTGGFGQFTLRRTTIEKFNASVTTLKTSAAQQAATETRTQNQAATLRVVQQYATELQQTNTTLAADMSRISALVPPLKARISALPKTTAKLKELQTAGKCADFVKLSDSDTFVRADISESLNNLGDYLNTMDTQLAEFARAAGLVTSAKNAFMANGGTAKQLPPAAQVDYAANVIKYRDFIRLTRADLVKLDQAMDASADANFELNCS